MLFISNITVIYDALVSALFYLLHSVTYLLIKMNGGKNVTEKNYQYGNKINKNQNLLLLITFYS